MSTRRRAKGGDEPRRIEVDVLKPVPRIDANYLRSASQIVETCVVESLQPIVLEELVKAARTGAYEAALNVTGLCDRFEHPVCVVSAALAMVKALQERGICAQIGKGRTRRLGYEVDVVILETSWREVGR